MAIRWHVVVATGTGLLLLAACEPIDESTSGSTSGDRTVERLAEDMRDAADVARDAAHKRWISFIEQAELRLREMREQLADARKREEMTEEARERFDAADEQLEEDIARLEGELRRLREDGDDSWYDELSPRIQNAMEDLSASYKRFRETHMRPSHPSEKTPQERGPSEPDPG